MKINSLSEIIGWCGMIFILTAYFLLSFNFLTSSNTIYQFLNLTGAGGVAYVSLKQKAYQAGTLNIVWFAIALVAIIKTIFNF